MESRSIRDPISLTKQVAIWRQQGHSIGFVPTMGCLHEGHMSLVHEARKRHDKVVVSIFVNPLQFGPSEDLAAYPRPLQQDLQLCHNAGVDLVFCPSASDLYTRDRMTFVDGGKLTKLYCGKTRPGHFSGVLTVIQILLNLVKPTQAFFGEKDFQQLFLIKQMCRDLWLDTEIIGMPIVREASGLAMSSRNTYLTSEQKRDALCLNRAITMIQDRVAAGHTQRTELITLARQIIQHTMTLDYAHIVDEKSLEPIGDFVTRPSRLLLAAYIGDSPRVRLIDNGALK